MAAKIQTILLATDLTERCEPAARRAAALALQWGARLHVLSVLSPTLLMDDDDEEDRILLAQTRERLEQQYGRSGAAVHVLIAPTSAAILDIAQQVSADLIVTGPSDSSFLQHTLLGDTLSALMKASPAPVLLVRNPADRQYRKLVAATDLSDASRAPVELAAELFGDSGRLTIFHAFDTPFRMFVSDSGAYEAGVRDGVIYEIREALAAWAIPNATEVPVVAQWGEPSQKLADFVDRELVDLVVTGTQGRSGLLDVLLGSVARAIADRVRCDVLLVPAAAAGKRSS